MLFYEFGVTLIFYYICGENRNMLFMKVTDEVLVASYSRTGNVWKTAVEVGVCGQTVYERLSKLGVVRKMNLWTADDDKVLLKEYARHKMENTLDELARSLGRTKQFICRKARVLGLTNAKEKVMSERSRLKLSESTKRWVSEHGHPRGFLGHKHGDATRKKLSERSHSSWCDPNSAHHSDFCRQKRSDNLHKMKMDGVLSVYSRCGDHVIDINGIRYTFKSSWEVEVAKRLQMLVDEGVIKGWGYEVKHFNFDDMKRGMRSYCPDFEVVLCDDSLMYIEVKGWKMPKAMKRIAMFRERYPDVKLYIIDEDEYSKVLSEGDYLRGRCFQVQPI